MWQTETPKPLPAASILDAGTVRLTINAKDLDGWQWQHFILSFGRDSEQAHSECLATWPRDALRIARENLDAFEKTLEEATDGLS